MNWQFLLGMAVGTLCIFAPSWFMVLASEALEKRLGQFQARMVVSVACITGGALIVWFVFP